MLSLLVAFFFIGIACAVTVWFATARLPKATRVALTALIFSILAAPGVVAGSGHPPIGVAPFIVAVLMQPRGIPYDFLSLCVVWVLACLMTAMVAHTVSALRADGQTASRQVLPAQANEVTPVPEIRLIEAGLSKRQRTLPYAAASMIVFAIAATLMFAANSVYKRVEFGVIVAACFLSLVFACIAWFGFRAGLEQFQSRPGQFAAFGLGVATSAAVATVCLAMNQILHIPSLLCLPLGLALAWGLSFGASFTVKGKSS
ncbi:MAG: hypothetical protein JSS42_08485 [Proteobacteria bacterium]|nr:hypothetical protein [Pseudomonadota bacterium]